MLHVDEGCTINEQTDAAANEDDQVLSHFLLEEEMVLLMIVELYKILLWFLVCFLWRFVAGLFGPWLQHR